MFELNQGFIVLVVLSVLAVIAYEIIKHRSTKNHSNSAMYVIMSTNSSGMKTEKWALACRSRHGDIRHEGKRYRLCCDRGMKGGRPCVGVTARDGKTITFRRSPRNLTAFPPNTEFEIV